MITHNLVQGSSEWHAHRTRYKNASDSPAVMGESKHKTRSQLLHEMHTGIAPEVDAATQRRFDDGHRFEALARPLAEKMLREALLPITGTEGEYGASFDGITFDDSVIWEHKSINDDLRRIKHADDLPLMYRIQMEHQLMVSGAERCLFSATKWDGEMLVDEIHFKYVPDMELRARIVAAWKMFDADLAAYVPPEPVQAAVAAPFMALPALAIQIKGEVTLSNLPQFREAAEKFIANIKTDLVTDEDFADAEATVKFCDAAEKNLEQAKNAAIAQTASIDELMRTIDHIKKQLSTKRLMLDKLVKSEKESRKAAIVDKARIAFNDHFKALESEINPIRLIAQHPDFGGAMKGLKKLSAMQEAVDNALRNGMFEADAIAKDIRMKLAWFNCTVLGYGMIFADLQSLAHKPMDDFQLAVTSRIDQHKAAETAKMDAAREQIRKEEVAKATKVLSDLAAKQQAEAEAKVLAEKLAEAHAQQHSESLRDAIKHVVTNGEAVVKTVLTESGPRETTVNDIRPPSQPSRESMIKVIAFEFGVEIETARAWLINEFQKRERAA